MDLKQRRHLISAVLKEWARMGGQASRRKLTKAQRSASAQKASRARWRKTKKQTPAA